MTAVIKVQNLTIGYHDTALISNANFDVQQGEIFTILGSSGSGKTTLMRHLIGLEIPLAGNIFIDNTDIFHAPYKQRKMLKQNIGVMFQSGALISSMTLLENVMLPLDEHTNLPSHIQRETAILKLALVGLAKHAHFYPSDISGGMVKRTAIARAMALDPKVIFLDEPSAGLDPITLTELDQTIKELAKNFGITFVIVTHELTTIRSIADRAIILNNGAIAAEGNIQYLEHAVDIPFVKQFFNSKKG